ncbi:SAV_2336 N-terminal domain-related protein [Streptacidiphilus sp. P02-A3a]|uniref:wHTH domain-containing protein n=1 Tax=Streptacidiphilus sp. P02-A3a TaxID=2704468 RepID=UPI0015FAC030|nr:SAV_2336 N-terminal domain-related protein [Streptacidiphilus sp. P02-A3a]QMU72445.1 hypothetical protein GXP74_33570 [Streptacidiphilus sp. P02-A3a]
MIARLGEVLAEALRACGYDPSPRELTEILWLAGQLPPAARPEVPAEEEPADAAVTAVASEPPQQQPPAAATPPAPRDDVRTVETRPIYSAANRTAASDGPRASSIRLPVPSALPRSRELSKALRSLRSNVASRTTFEIDIAATVASLASGMPDVLLQPIREPRFDLTLIVDDGESMAIWYDTARELRTALYQLHAFRRTRFLGLNTDLDDGSLSLTTEPFRLHAPAISPAAAVEAGERSLVVVLTDGVGLAWHSGAALNLLSSWARRSPVAVWHLLPEALWPDTALSAARRRTTAPRPGVANRKLTVRAPRIRTRHDRTIQLPLPVVDIGAGTATAAWARLIGAPSGEVILPLMDAVPPVAEHGTIDDEEWPATEVPALELLDGFLGSATPLARRLAAHLACVPPITVPLMRLVQQSAAPEAALSHLAEVFLSGLLQPTTATGAPAPPAEETPWGQRYYAFLPEVVDPLRELIPRSAEHGTSTLVSRHLRRINQSRDAALALISDPRGTTAYTPQAPELAWSDLQSTTSAPSDADVPFEAPSIIEGPEGMGGAAVAEEGPVPVGFIIGIALGKGLRIRAAATLLRQSGYPVPEPTALPDLVPESPDVVVLSLHLDGSLWADPGHQWLDVNEPVTMGHVLAAAASTGQSARHLAERLGELGYRTPSPTKLPADPPEKSDRMLISRDLDEAEPWLDANEPVKVGQVLSAAVKTGQSAQRVAERLRELGYDTPDPAQLPEVAPEEADLILINLDLHSVGARLDPGEPTPMGHVLAAAVRTGQSAQRVAERLRELGYDAPDPAQLPDVLPEEADQTLISQDLDAVPPWLDASRPVRVGHALAAAIVTEQSAQRVAERLRELGYDAPDPAQLPDVVPDEADQTLISQDLDAVPPWLDASEPVPVGHALTAAIVTDQTAQRVAERLRELGYHTTASAQLPDIVPEEDDRILISRRLDGMSRWIDPAEPVTVEHLLTAAIVTGRSARAAAERLRELGYHTTALAQLPDIVPEEDDRILISRRLDGMSRWIDPAEPVTVEHLLTAAIVTGRSARATAERLRELGYHTPDPAHLPDIAPEYDDQILISRYLHRGPLEDPTEAGPEWLDAGDPVAMGHVSAAAIVTEQSARTVAERLRELGYQTPDPAGLPDTPPADADRTLISRDLDAVGPWLDASEAVTVAHVLAAATAIQQSARAVAERLRELGFQTKHPAQLSDVIPEDDDRILISRYLDGYALEDLDADWLDAREPVPKGHVLAAAIVTGRPALAVANRLNELGYRTPAGVRWPDFSPEDVDRTLISLDLDAVGPWLDATDPVTVGHVLAAARKTGWSAHRVGERLHLLGYSPPASVILPDAIDK